MNDSSIHSPFSKSRKLQALGDLEALAQRLRHLVASQPPKDLLGYLYAALVFGGLENEGASSHRTTTLPRIELDEAQFLLEFVHAILATTPISGDAKLDESICEEITRVATELRNASFTVAMLIAATSSEAQFGPYTKDLLFRALSNLTLPSNSVSHNRGHELACLA